MTFLELLEGFGKAIGAELPPPENGSVMMEVDDMPVVIQEVAALNAVVMMAPIGMPPPENQEQLLTALLNANHLFAGTGGGTLSRDPESGMFCLCRLLPLVALEIETFTSAMESFLNVMETWKKLIADYRPTVTTDASEESPISANPGFDAGWRIEV